MRTCIHLARRLGVCLLLGLPLVAFAGPGDGVHIGPVVVSPYLDLSFTDDSNVYLDGSNVIQDTFFEPELGIRFSSSSDTNLLSLRGNAFYSERGYSNEKDANFNTYGDNITLRYGNGRRSLIELIQSYRSLDDLDKHAADIESSALAGEMIEDTGTLDLQREINQLGASIMRRMTDKLELGLSYRYSGVRYENATHDRLDNKQEEYVPEGLDLDGNILQLDGALGLTDKTDAILTLRQGLEYQEGYDEPALFSTLRIGLKTQQAEKLVYTIGGGFERYTRHVSVTSYDETFGETLSLTNDDETVTFNFNAAVDWFITEKLTFRCGGYNGTQWSAFYSGNAYEYISGWAGLGYRWKPSTTFSVRGIYRVDDYLDPVTHLGVTSDRVDDRIEGHARIDYLVPGEFVRLYLEATYDEVDSNLDWVDYVDKRLILGVNFRY